MNSAAPVAHPHMLLLSDHSKLYINLVFPLILGEKGSIQGHHVHLEFYVGRHADSRPRVNFPCAEWLTWAI